MKIRDLSEKQFRAAARRSGFTPAFFGYWSLADPVSNVSVYLLNGGSTRRSQLAYLIEQQNKQEREREKSTGVVFLGC